MKTRIAVSFSAFILLIATSGVPAVAADSGWMGQSRFVGQIRKFRASGQIPVKIECRNASSNPASLKLEIRVTEAANAQKRDWVAYTADSEYQPVSPAEAANWRKASGMVLKRSGGNVHCSIYHHKKDGTVSSRAPAIWKKTSSGIRTLN